ncbi:SpoIIE family protein phosphatase [Streptomyces triticiradicis]|uniref:protein-serine/threonine phosphatase n=1 Tax=Streptomyces triticiradicis TaxID=2651189 RepID=A0A7J5DPM6_9ACTN|nr:SpoIIE family protein phosphatase [Streptomyces triticiradicis]KAB1990730.1 SpoIIE family protein phosphatase [Streptomyces triticiradicis]
MIRRLDLLDTADDGITESEVFRLALQHSIAELGCVGGAVYLRGPMSALRLVYSTGLPSSLTRAWEIVDQDGPTATARAVRSGEHVWVAALPSDLDEPTAPLLSRSGWFSVPLVHEDRAIGAITCLTGDNEEPTSEQWTFLTAVAEWTMNRLRKMPEPARLGTDLDATPVGSWEWDVRTGELVWDQTAMKVYQTEPREFAPVVETWMKVVHPDDLASTLAAAERSIRTHAPFEAEYRIRRSDGGYTWTRASGHVVLDDEGQVARIVGKGWASDAARSTRDALSRALRYMSDAFLSVDDDWRITFANLEAERVLGSADEMLFGRNLWDLPALRHVPDLEERCRSGAARSTAAGFDITLADTGRCYDLRIVPVPGGLTVYFTDVTERRRREAEQAAAVRAAAERASRTAELTTQLAAATTSEDVVTAVAQRVLPPFGAQGLLVLVLEDERLVHIGSVGYPAPFLRQMHGAHGMEPTDADPVGRAVLSGEPRFCSSREEWSTAFPDAGSRPPTDKEAWAFLPLTASGHTFGVCVIAFDAPRHLTSEERTLLITISALVAHALERARLYEAELTRSEELQQALLPRGLPTVPETTAVARYLPAGQTSDVGGDWYDLIPLSAGQVALVVGDVMGHGLSEAATMGRLRTALHTLAALELPPDEIMGHLNDIVSGLGEHAYATCLFALYDSTDGSCTVVRAGHPPPLVVRPDGSAHFPEIAVNPPLGAASPPFETTELELPAESLLVLYTDGLVESPQREIDQGMSQLAGLLAGQAGCPDLEDLCDSVASGLLPGGPTADDAALLIARLHHVADRQVASWALPEGPEAAGEARRHVREQLAQWHLDDLVMTTELLASELVGNVIRHACGPIGLRLLCSGTLVCEVSDASLTMPRIRRATDTDEGGRGLQLINALCERWGSRYTPDGKAIWTEQALPGAAEQADDEGPVGSPGPPS